MLGVLSTNLSRRNMEAKLYEMATVYKKQPGKVLADERTVLTLGAYGGDVDFFALKGAVEALLCRLVPRTCASPPTRRPPRSIPAAAPQCGRAIRASARSARSTPTCALPTGSTARRTAPRSTSCCCTISRVRSRSIRRCRASRPSRATSPSCDAAVPVGELTECIRKAEKNVLRGVKLFDVYTGVGIPEGKKSVAFSLTLRSDDGTLTDDHAEEAVRAVLDALRESFGAVIR